MSKSINEEYKDLLDDFEDHKKLLDLELTVASASEALAFYTSFESRAASRHRDSPNRRWEEMRGQLFGSGDILCPFRKLRQYLPSLGESFLKARDWFHPPSWASSFDDAQRKRLEGTCDWILEHPQYQMWQCAVCDPDESLAKRSLSLQGMPTLLWTSHLKHARF